MPRLPLGPSMIPSAGLHAPRRSRPATRLVATAAGLVIWIGPVASGLQSAEPPTSPPPAGTVPVTDPGPVVEPTPADAPLAITTEDLDAIASRIETESSPAATAALTEARGQLDRVQAQIAEQAPIKAELAAVPTTLEATRADLGRPTRTPTVTLPAEATVAQAEQQRDAAIEKLESLRRALTTLEAEATRRPERITAINARIALLRTATDELRAAAAGPIGPEVPVDAAAAAAAARATAAANRAEIDRLQIEAENYAKRADLLPLRRALAARLVDEQQALVDAWRDLVSTKRATGSTQVGGDIRTRPDAIRDRASRTSFPEDFAPLIAFAESTADRLSLATLDPLKSKSDPKSDAKLFEEWRQKDRTRSEALKRLRLEYREARSRIERTGMNRATGIVLRRHFSDLPEPNELSRKLRVISRLIARAELLKLELEDERDVALQTSVVADRLVAEAIEAFRLRGGDPSGTANSGAGAAPAAAGAAGSEDGAAAPAIAPQYSATETAILETVRPLAVTVADDRARLVEENLDTAEAAAEALESLDETTRELLAATVAYEAFIRERILWIQSIPGSGIPSGPALTAAIAPLTSPTLWGRTAEGVAGALLAEWFIYVPLLLLATAIIIAGPRLRSRIRAAGALVGSYRTDSYGHTWKVLGLETVNAAGIPLLLFTIGYAATRVTGTVALGAPVSTAPGSPAVAAFSLSTLAAPIGAGLIASALALLPLSLLRGAMRSNGLGDAHFRWPVRRLSFMRRHLRWLVPSLVPLIGLELAIHRFDDDVLITSFGRIAFASIMLLQAAFLALVLRPRGPVMVDVLSGHRGGWLERLRWVWYPLAVGVPVTLVVVAALGWFYTARELHLRTEATLTLTLGVVLAQAMLMRWLFIARRQVAVDDARRRREEALKRAATEAGEIDDDEPREMAVISIDEQKLDLPSISAQTRQLFRTAIVLTLVAGTFIVWADVMPALRVLARVQVYPSITTVEVASDLSVPALEVAPPALVPVTGAPPVPGPGAAEAPGGNGNGSGSGANGSGSGSTSSPLGPLVPGTSDGEATADEAGPELTITLADLGLSLVMLIITIVAFRNVPGLIEISVLQRLPLDAGSRYALNTVIRYLIAIVGIIIVFGTLGLTWSKLQWLAAALTFGLAFGLQEIFANFISGLIILGERPIRVGDTVTVGTVSGVVQRIRMRATTISDFDRKELIVPNKTFITTDVINWTLSDPMLRLVIPIGVSYDSDVERVQRVLMEVATAQDKVLADPKPQALFLRFGDSTLDHELRVFLGTVEHLIAVKHGLHNAIIKRFRAEGIEIAFPQRDLHLRSTGDLKELLVPRDAAKGGPVA